MAIFSNTAAGAASTTMSASASRSSGTTRGGARKPRTLAVGLRRIARSHGDELQPVDAGIQCPRQLQADRAEAADRDRLPHASPSAMARASARSSGVLTLRKGSHFATAKSTRRMPIAPAKCATSRRPVADSNRRRLSRQVIGQSATRWCSRPLLAAQAGGGASAAASPRRNEWGIAGHRQQRIGAQSGGPVEACQHAGKRSLAGKRAVGQHRQVQSGEPCRIAIGADRDAAGVQSQR